MSQASAATPTSKRKVTIGSALGYAIGDFYGGGSTTLTGTYLALFWTMFAGLNIAQAQSIIGVATIVSAVSSIVFGSLSDNFYRYKLGRKFGRRRFFLLLASPLVLVTALMWIPSLPFAVYFALYTLFIVVLQMFLVSYSSLPTEMTSDYNGRTLLSTVRMIVSGVSTVAIPAVGGWTLSMIGEDKAISYQSFAIGTTILFAIVLFIVSRTTWEMTPEEAGYDVAKIEAEKKEPFSFSRWCKNVGSLAVDYISTFRISSFRKFMGIYLLSHCMMDIFGQTFVFFAIFCWNKNTAFASMLLSFAVIAEFFKPVWGLLFAKIGPRNIFQLAFGLGIVALGGLFATWKLQPSMDDGQFTMVAIAVCVFWFIARGLIWFPCWTVFPFIPDVDEIVSGKNRTSIFTGSTYFIARILKGFVSMAIGGYLAYVGFDSKATSADAGVQNGIVFVMIGWTVIGLVLSWIIALTFKLDKRTDGILNDEINRLKSGGRKADVTSETKKVVESLTGVPYEKCWPQAQA